MPIRRRTSLAMLALATAGLAACGSSPTGGDDNDDDDPLTPASITMTTERTTRARNETFTLAPVVRNAANEVITPTIAFTSSSTSTATVTADGTVTAKNPGTTTLRATAGTVHAEVQITVVDGALVGPAGGTVTTGSASLTVPAGALTAETVVSLRFVTAPIQDPTGTINAIVEVGPANVAFSTPATLALTIPSSGSPLGLPVESTGIRRLEGNAWVNADQPTIDAGTRRATARVNGAGQFSGGRLIPTQPCTAPEHRQFDYWVDQWRVSVNGQAVANSDITIEPGGCAILERWQPFGGGLGLSISFYNPATQLWYQSYVDNTGWRLSVSGGVDAQGQMVLKTPGDQSYERWSWLKEGPNVRQRAVFTNNGGNSFAAPHFDGVYSPR